MVRKDRHHWMQVAAEVPDDGEALERRRQKHRAERQVHRAWRAAALRWNTREKERHVSTERHHPLFADEGLTAGRIMLLHERLRRFFGACACDRPNGKHEETMREACRHFQLVCEVEDAFREMSA